MNIGMMRGTDATHSSQIKTSTSDQSKEEEEEDFYMS
jgi:hypothetical protein